MLGPLDGTRLPRFVKGEARAAAPCRPLSASEQSDYDAMLAKEDPRLARWHEPPKLAAVRSLLARIAGRHSATYWDLSSFMGGPCSIDRWARAAPPSPCPTTCISSDEGSRRVGQAIYAALIKGYERYRQQAAGSGGPDSVTDGNSATPERVAGPPVPAP